MSARTRLKNKRLLSQGFTLLEVMIAVTILAFLSLMTTQSIQRSLQTKAKLQKSIDRNSEIREALRIMEHDINMAFHYRDWATDLYNQSEQARRGSQNGQPNSQPGNSQPGANQSSQTKQPNNNLPPFQPRVPPIQLTHFMGEESTLSFTALSHPRVIRDDMSSSQQKVGYFLRECKSRTDQKKTTKCLWRRTDPLLDDDVTKGGQEVPLLEDVEELKFRYLGANKQDWLKEWKTKEGDAELADTFPDAVEITLTINNRSIDKNHVEKNLPLKLQTVAAIRFPNNRPQPQQPPQQPFSLPGAPPNASTH